jgi:predicted ATP-dependent endonuclease of OLD family
MRLRTAHIQNYRSIRDTGDFEIDHDKTILVGINEAGKSAILQALQHINPPKEVRPLAPLRDYPRSHYNEDINRGGRNPAEIPVATVVFGLEKEDHAALPEHMRKAVTGFKVAVFLDNHRTYELIGNIERLPYKDIKNDLRRIAAHADQAAQKKEPPQDAKADASLTAIEQSLSGDTPLSTADRKAIRDWMKKILPELEEGSDAEKKLNAVEERLDIDQKVDTSVDVLRERVPRFVLFSNYFKVRARLHLDSLARKQAGDEPIDPQDYGNLCLLNLLGYTAKELATLGRISDEERKNHDDQIEARIDERRARLDAAEEELTREVRRIWNPDPGKDEAKTLRLQADGPYLKVTVQDAIGSNIDLDQRSEGFQWLVSFFTVFFSEAKGQHKNAILLLDEPGLSLHALKQREFQKTISRLAETNQTVFTTHSPFLVGSGELDKVRVVEMTDREIGTKVHTSVTSSDPAALLPLQEALGYDMAHSLFANERNLVTEGLTDYFYIDAMTQLLRSGGVADLNPKIAIVPAGDAGKVVYFATILHAHNLKVAALLDSDSAGENAARQDTLVHTLKQRAIVRTRDFLKNEVKGAEIEDLLRETLIGVANTEFGTNAKAIADAQPKRPIVDILAKEVPDFSKYKLAKAFARWSREHAASDLTDDEREQWKALVDHLNKALK